MFVTKCFEVLFEMLSSCGAARLVSATAPWSHQRLSAVRRNTASDTSESK